MSATEEKASAIRHGARGGEKAPPARPQDEHLSPRAFRAAWMLVLASLVYVLIFFLLAFLANRPATPPEWNMGAAPFVPASDIGADGYPIVGAPPDPAAPGEGAGR